MCDCNEYHYTLIIYDKLIQFAYYTKFNHFYERTLKYERRFKLNLTF